MLIWPWLSRTNGFSCFDNQDIARELYPNDWFMPGDFGPPIPDDYTAEDLEQKIAMLTQEIETPSLLPVQEQKRQRIEYGAIQRLGLDEYKRRQSERRQVVFVCVVHGFCVRSST